MLQKKGTVNLKHYQQKFSRHREKKKEKINRTSVNGRPISTSDIILISYKNIGLIKYLMNNKQKFSNSDKKFYEYTKKSRQDKSQ